MTAALPVSVAPRPGESIESWLEHLADANGLTTAQLLAATDHGRAGNRYLTLAPSPETIARLAALARVDEKDVYAATLASFDGTALDLTGLDPADRLLLPAGRRPRLDPAHGTQICPACIADTGAWKTAWRLLLVTACTDHGLVLVAECPSCGRPFRDQRHSHLRRVGAAIGVREPARPGTGQAVPARPHQPPAGAGLAGGARDPGANQLGPQPVSTSLVLGQPAKPAAYLADLRHLTTLLLHLAGQPGADGLAPWVADLALVAADRTSTRGPRWGMRPPDDPALRGQALATADAILAADDLDTAATLLTPWTELTPTTNDGPLGWLADRTVMTPTLTRLVMAARAPHRRLSHHLDTPRSDGARMPINLLVIPQVIPHEQYLEHLAGASRLQRGDRPTLRLPVAGAAAPGHQVLGRRRRSPRHARPDGSALRPCLLGDHAHHRRRMEGPDLARHRGVTTQRLPRYRSQDPHRLGMSRWFDEWARRYPARHPARLLRPRSDLAMGPRRPRPPRPLTRLARKEADRQGPRPLPHVRALARRQAATPSPQSIEQPHPRVRSWGRRPHGRRSGLVSGDGTSRGRDTDRWKPLDPVSSDQVVRLAGRLAIADRRPQRHRPIELQRPAVRRKWSHGLGSAAASTQVYGGRVLHRDVHMP
jgi:hypothetical protein